MRIESIATIVMSLLISSLSGGCGSPKPASEEAQPLQRSVPKPYELRLPLGLSPESAVIPKDNPLTLEKVKLGKRLFFDKNLSFDRTISCASCHLPEKAFADDEQFSTGIAGKKGDRNAPAAINRLFSAQQFWDGRATSLEEQAIGPVQNPVEMGMPDMQLVLERLRQDASYPAAFKEAFPPEGELSEKNVARAIASFERTILSGNSPYDRFLAGNKSALSASAQRGLQIFRGKGNCETCHASFNFTDENYNNIGVGMSAARPDLGRFKITKLDGHEGAFKTPTLREVANTAPYMHDGSQKSLEEVVDFYSKGGHPNKWLSPKMKPLNLSDQEKRDLVEFLKSLSGQVSWYGKGSSQ